MYDEEKGLEELRVRECRKEDEIRMNGIEVYEERKIKDLVREIKERDREIEWLKDRKNRLVKEIKGRDKEIEEKEEFWNEELGKKDLEISRLRDKLEDRNEIIGYLRDDIEEEKEDDEN